MNKDWSFNVVALPWLNHRIPNVFISTDGPIFLILGVLGSVPCGLLALLWSVVVAIIGPFFFKHDWNPQKKRVSAASYRALSAKNGRLRPPTIPNASPKDSEDEFPGMENEHLR